MSSSATAPEISAAQRLQQQHAENPLHTVTVEDVPDEELQSPRASDAPGSSSWAQPVSSKAAGKQKAQNDGLDTQSHEAFPELGMSKTKSTSNPAPVWSTKVNGGTNGAASTNGTPCTATPVSRTATPTGAPPPMSIPGRNVETVVLEPRYVLPRNQLRRPLPDIVKDINRKSRATISMLSAPNGNYRFEASGPQAHAQQALRELVQQIGSKQIVKVPIPYSARSHVIGKQGSTIRSIQEKSGARIQLPRTDDGLDGLEDDEDSTIDVTIEGNALSAAMARDAINKIVGERSASASARLKSIPAEFYPFLSGPSNTVVNAIETDHGVQIRIPPHQPWSHTIPEASTPEKRPTFSPATNDNHIQIAGDRTAVQAARAEIERRAQELHDQLQTETMEIMRGRHQFIIGDRGISMDEFFADTDCVIILPDEEGVETVAVIGTKDDINRGVEKAMDLAMGLQLSPVDIAKMHKHAAGGAVTYARDVSRYLRQRQEIERLEKLHQVHINTPFAEGQVSPWELYARDGKNILRAQKEVASIINSHPPSRLSSVDIDPFFHAYLRSDIRPRLQEDFGVHLVVPDVSEADLPIVLVYEGTTAPGVAYQVPQKAPGADELRAFQQGLADARGHILELINKQEQVISESIEVPLKFQERLRKFIKKEQDATTRAAGKIPVRVSVRGTTVTMRGPTSAVQSLAAKAEAFVEQEKEDEKERGFTMKFDFPQKHANQLIGKGGSHINELREKFDVDIQVQNGEVELKGPKAKAEKAKAHISALSRKWTDETTYSLKIEPKYHGELIGAQGSQITRLQSRYGVHINFPRTAKAARDDESAADMASEAGKPKRQQELDEVVIRGPKEKADKAREEIYALYQWLRDNSFTTTVTVQRKQLPSLIGAGGSSMEELRQTTGAKIDILGERDDTGGGLVEVHIKGTKSQIAAAKNIIEERKAVFDDTITKTVDVDRKWHKLLIGPGGSTLRDIVVKAGGPEDRRLQARTVQFPRQDTDGNAVKVEGRQDVVNKIIASIEAMVSQRESQVTDTVAVPVEKHRTLIGRGGETKRQLESQFNVSIDIPRQGSGQTDVKLLGLPSDVEKAKGHISSLVKEQEGATMQVPKKYHHAISENGQFFRRLRNDHRVTVDHAGQEPPAKPQMANSGTNNSALPLITDDAESNVNGHSWTVVDNAFATGEEGDIPWVLKGNPENIQKAKKAVESALEQARANSTVGYLVLPDPSTYRYVIGQGGSTVSSIRKQSGCKINVPRAQTQDEPIEIVGSGSGCETAKNMILEAVQEGLAARRD